MTEPRMSRKERRLLREKQRMLDEATMASTVPSRGVEVPSSDSPDFDNTTGAIDDPTTQRPAHMPEVSAVPAFPHGPAISDSQALPENLGGRDFASSPTQGEPAGDHYTHTTVDQRAQAEKRLAEARAKLEALKAREQQNKQDEAYGSVKPRTRKRRFDVISWFGEVLVTVGVILGLFAFWQVVVTDMQVADLTHNALVSFYDDVECPSTVSKDKRTEDPPVMSAPSGGGTFAALHIPRWDYASLPIRQSTVKAVLDAGAAGHYDETVMPGDIGNFSIAAHRGGFGSSFKRIAELEDGDAVVIETKDAWYVYKMYAKEIVLPHENRVIYPVPNDKNAEPKERLMTMTTCHPMYGASERFIVHLKFDYWTPHSAGVPEELAQGGKFECT